MTTEEVVDPANRILGPDYSGKGLMQVIVGDRPAHDFLVSSPLPC